MANKAATVQSMSTAWSDVISDIGNTKIPPRKAQIQYNMLMRYWLVEDGRISWDRVIMVREYPDSKFGLRDKNKSFNFDKVFFRSST